MQVIHKLQMKHTRLARFQNLGRLEGGSYSRHMLHKAIKERLITTGLSERCL